jgi:hypothetical protein
MLVLLVTCGTRLMQVRQIPATGFLKIVGVRRRRFFYLHPFHPSSATYSTFMTDVAVLFGYFQYNL